ncbi:hypothetical protein D1610_03520 [Sphingomonas gilva]|uniref:Uncharacterized protein n=1 Tax=Sphingomonas gilva TaxID=2305907 RepID=A0A396RRP0_9SPHN|nr:hypothetical protein [Sphingomonas gilva]RHW19190.1 hypothetical protein D1610_03520 [Sphingomonas gilva]
MFRLIKARHGRALWLFFAIAALAAALPLTVVTLPPLVDAPGHLARISIAVQQAADPSVMADYVVVHPQIVPNLAIDAPVMLLAPWVGVISAFWLITLLTPIMMVGALALVVRAWNRDGAAGIGWALLFVWSSPFMWGFINYWLATALALIGFAGWKLLDPKPRTREALFWAAIPFVFLAHAIAGCLMVMLIGMWELGRATGALGYRPVPIARELLTRCRPLIAILPLIAWWRLSGTSVEGEQGDGTHWSLPSKFEELAAILRDQHMVFDIACVLAAIGVIILGWRRGARFAGGTGWPIAAVWIAYIVLPFSTEGGSYLDMRLAPVGLMLALALQDWRGVAPGTARAILFMGVALFALRLAITTHAFVGYEAANRSTLSALNHVERGARIMAFTERSCRQWPHAANSHIPSMAVHYRQAWINSLWDVSGLHATEVIYRPSPIYYHDPSQHIWPPDCPNVGRDITDLRGGRSVREVLMTLPPDGYDYLWISGDRLTPAQARGRFTEIWSDANGALYRRLDSRALTGLSSAASSSAQPKPTSQPAATSLGQ